MVLCPCRSRQFLRVVLSENRRRECRVSGFLLRLPPMIRKRLVKAVRFLSFTRSLAAALAVLSLGLLAGCTTTQLHKAASRGDVSEIRKLLSQGSIVNETNLDGMTPLMFAAVAGRKAAVVELLAQGADPFAGLRMDRTQTAQTLARYSGHREIADILAAAEGNLPVGQPAAPLLSASQPRESAEPSLPAVFSDIDAPFRKGAERPDDRPPP